MKSKRRFFPGPWLLTGLLVMLAGIVFGGCLIPGLEGFGFVRACENGVWSSPVSSDEPGWAEDERETVYVNIRNFRFHPAELEVRTGTRIVFVNEDDVEHNILQTSTRRVGAEPPLFESPVLEEGDIWSFIVQQPGEYPFICTVDAHQLAGMVGRIVVVDDEQ